MKPWSKHRRDRLLALAAFFDHCAARIRRRVREHTPKRSTKPHLVKERAA